MIMIKFLLKKWKTIFFLVFISGAMFLRVTHFEDWMIIKSDQIRDAMVSVNVLEEGVGAFSLLGPRAGGTNFRLGPAFYSFQSFSALLFQSVSPGVLALPTLLFSLLSIPLFFLVARRLFDKDQSMILTVVFSYGFLAIEYSRFSWNPNSTSFFCLLFLYAFFRILSDDISKKTQWYALLGLSYGIASQLHFTVLAALPLFVVLFSLFRWRRVHSAFLWRGFGIFCAVVLLFYLPVIASDLLSEGKNVGQFFEAVETKESEKLLFENICRVTKNFGEYFFRIAFGYFDGPRPFQYAGIVLLGAGLSLSIFLFRKERDELRRDVLLAIPIFTMTFFLLFIPVATTVDKPRFFLPMLFVPVLFFGMIALLPFSGKKKVFAFSLACVLLVFSMGSNMFFTYHWLSEIRMSTHQYVSPKKDTVVLKMKKDKMWWSWGQIKQATEFMIKDCPHENILIEYKGQAADFMHTILYAFRLAGDERIRRSRTYDGPSFCKYTLTKAKPGGNAEDDQWDIGDLRIVVLDKRGGKFDTSTRSKKSDIEEIGEKYEHWSDVMRIFNPPVGG